MLLAEALILRADAQKRLSSLASRLAAVALVQEGEEPAEDPQALLAEHEAAAEALESLIRRINRTNAATALGDGTLTDALAARDVLALRITALRSLADAASPVRGRVTRSEVRYQSTIDVVETRRQADDLSRQRRELDTQIQAANWTTDLLD